MFILTRALLFSLTVLPLVSATVHDIQVGGKNGELEFSPEAIGAQPGDQVIFHFNPKNHTVTQSSFANPCGPKDGGFDSGFQPVMSNQTQPTYTITVNDTNPIWVYCRQTVPASHCGKGMVFAVNCGADGSPNSFTGFKNAALAVGAAAAATSSSGSGYPGYPLPSATVPSVPTPSSTPTTSTGGRTIKVVVGGPNVFAFDPPSISAQPNDIVQFEFHQKNHSVTQSSFAQPCQPLNANGTTGFDSGFLPIADGASNFSTWSLTVNDTKPIWAFCRQTNPKSHCGTGMVFAINAVDNSDRSFAAFQSNAESTGTNAVSSESTSSSAAMTIHAGGSIATLVTIALLFWVL
ncbi:hypothetical protein AMATHDRAFT_52238 [Amanita thiersii Skay4041]|uniref:Cupredoxin n=1 Tax=Amanita thiersii Skay4041 TaxID=703135 RepID=A0A2A9P1H2_9AGAR|nr:hypothetical protein AMATHDRAFT_52238 [Amanita thiersii Skay4041]